MSNPKIAAGLRELMGFHLKKDEPWRVGGGIVGTGGAYKHDPAGSKLEFVKPPEIDSSAAVPVEKWESKGSFTPAVDIQLPQYATGEWLDEASDFKEPSKPKELEEGFGSW